MQTLDRLSPSSIPNPKGLVLKPCGFLRRANKYPDKSSLFTGFCLLILLLAGCGGAESQATLTAQANRNMQQATRLAEGLQDTDQAKIAGVTSTHQANRQQTAQAELEQQATIDAEAATEQAYAAQSTAEALELQQFIQSARNWPAFVADSFDTQNYEWPVTSETFPAGSVSLMFESGKYIWAATARQGYVYWTYPTEQPVSDFYLSVEVQQTGGASDAEAGLVFHAAGQDYWCFLISGEGDLFIGLRVDDGWQLSWPLGSSSVHTGEPNRLTVINQNSHYLFLINGNDLMSIGDADLPVGPVGLMIGMWDPGDQGAAETTAAWEFDNFELRTPGTPAPPATSTP